MTKEIKYLLAENLRNLMQKHYNLNTQMQVREASQKLHPKTGAVITPGLTQSTIQRALSAKVNVNLDTLQRLAEVFNVSPITLISDKDVTGENIEPKSSEFAWALMDKFDSLAQDPTLRAQAFNACVVALGIVEQQHAPQKRAPKRFETLKKVRG